MGVTMVTTSRTLTTATTSNECPTSQLRGGDDDPDEDGDDGDDVDEWDDESSDREHGLAE